MINFLFYYPVLAFILFLFSFTIVMSYFVILFHLIKERILITSSFKKLIEVSLLFVIMGSYCFYYVQSKNNMMNLEIGKNYKVMPALFTGGEISLIKKEYQPEALLLENQGLKNSSITESFVLSLQCDNLGYFECAETIKNGLDNYL